MQSEQKTNHYNNQVNIGIAIAYTLSDQTILIPSKLERPNN